MSSLIDHLGDEWGSLLTPVAADLPAPAAVPAAPDAPAPDPAALLQEVLDRVDDASVGDSAAPARGMLEEILASEEYFAPLAYPADEVEILQAPDVLDGGV